MRAACGALALLCALALSAHAVDLMEDQVLIADDGAAALEFGWTTAINCMGGPTDCIAAVGSGKADSNAGAVYVYRLNAEGTWDFEIRLTANSSPDPASPATLGQALAAYDNKICAGAWSATIDDVTMAGAVYVFARDSNGLWQQEVKLTAPTPVDMAMFGRYVVMEGDTIVVSAYEEKVGDNTEQGRAYVYQFDGDTWNLFQTLAGSDATTHDKFGIAMAMDGNWLVVGAYTKDSTADDPNGVVSEQGVAYVFQRADESSQWIEHTILHAPTPAAPLTVLGEAADTYADDYYAAGGYSHGVGIDGTTIVVGAPWIDEKRGFGFVYEYDSDTDTWAWAQTMTAGVPQKMSMFGRIPSISEGIMTIGQWDSKGDTPGSAYVYTKNADTGVWEEQYHIKPSEGTNGDGFAHHIEVSWGWICSGSWYALVGANEDQGKSYLYDVTSLLAPGAPPPPFPPPSLAAAAEKIKVGVMVELQFGDSYALAYDAATAAMHEANEHLVAIGGLYQLEFVVVDPGYDDAARAQNSLQTIIDSGAKVVIGPFWSSTIENIKDMAEEAGILILTPASTAAVLELDDNILRFLRNDQDAANAITQVMIADGCDCLATVNVDDEWGNGMADDIRAEWSLNGLTLLGSNFKFDTDETSFGSVLSQMRGPVTVTGFGRRCGNACVQVTAASAQSEAVLAEALASQPEMVGASWYGSTELITWNDEGAKEFAAATGGFPVTRYAGFDPGNAEYNLIYEQQNEEIGGSDLWSLLMYEIVWTVARTVQHFTSTGTMADAKAAVMLDAEQSYGPTGWLKLDETTGDRAEGNFETLRYFTAYAMGTSSAVQTNYVEYDSAGMPSLWADTTSYSTVTFINTYETNICVQAGTNEVTLASGSSHSETGVVSTFAPGYFSFIYAKGTCDTVTDWDEQGVRLTMRIGVSTGASISFASSRTGPGSRVLGACDLHYATSTESATVDITSGCSMVDLGDGFCDSLCNVEEFQYDLGDCDIDGFFGPVELHGTGEKTFGEIIEMLGGADFIEEQLINCEAKSAVLYGTAASVDAADGATDPPPADLDIVMGILIELDQGEAYTMARTSILAHTVTLNALMAESGGSFTTVEPTTTLTLGDDASAIAALESLADQGATLVLGPFWTSSALAVLARATELDIILMSPTSTASSAAAVDNLLRFARPDADTAQGISFLLAQSSVNCAVLVNLDDTWGNGMASGVSQGLADYGVTVLDSFTYASGTTDFAATLTSVATALSGASAACTNLAVQMSGSVELETFFTQAAASDAVLKTAAWYGSDERLAFVDADALAFVDEVGGFHSTEFVGHMISAGSYDAAAAAAIAEGGENDSWSLRCIDIMNIVVKHAETRSATGGAESVLSSMLNAARTSFGATGWLALDANGDRAQGDYGVMEVEEASTRRMRRMTESAGEENPNLLTTVESLVAVDGSGTMSMLTDVNTPKNLRISNNFSVPICAFTGTGWETIEEGAFATIPFTQNILMPVQIAMPYIKEECDCPGTPVDGLCMEDVTFGGSHTEIQFSASAVTADSLVTWQHSAVLKSPTEVLATGWTKVFSAPVVPPDEYVIEHIHYECFTAADIHDGVCDEICGRDDRDDCDGSNPGIAAAAVLGSVVAVALIAKIAWPFIFPHAGAPPEGAPLKGGEASV